MMLRISGIKISPKDGLSDEVLKKAVEKKTGVRAASVSIFRKSIDARDKNAVVYNLTLNFTVTEKEDEKRLLRRREISPAKEPSYIIEKKKRDFRPVVVGFGPGGFMAGLYLAEAGLRPIILERGRNAESRKADIERFFETGVLDTESNVQFGEGGAGTFSDGKLNTGVNDPRIRYVLRTFVENGAPKEILYSAKPHVGTDRLIGMIQNIRKRIEGLGGEVLFEKKVTSLSFKNGRLEGVVCGDEVFPTKAAVLSIGHSARDTFEMLNNMGVPMERKGFSVGVRAEHSREFINRAQYGEFAKLLPSADYKLSTHLKDGRGVYSFCMCPGGYVVAAASEKGGVVTNGMSNFARDGKNSNAAILVGLMPEDFTGEGPLAGMYFQRELERKAFLAGGGGYKAPGQNIADFAKGRASKELFGIEPTYKPGVVPGDFRDIFPKFIYESLREGLLKFDNMIKGYGSGDGVLTAVESRSSSPVRIIRDAESLESPLFGGLYPCGEGAGYAGGIMSAAVDGLKIAERIAQRADF